MKKNVDSLRDLMQGFPNDGSDFIFQKRQRSSKFVRNPWGKKEINQVMMKEKVTPTRWTTIEKSSENFSVLSDILWQH